MAITTNTYAIVDTGYYNSLASGLQGAQATDIAYSGAEILIYIKSMVWQFSVNMDSKAGTGYTNPSGTQIGIYDSDKVSVNNPTINCSCYANINDSAQLAYLKALEKCTRTHGYKEFYYKSDNDAEYADRNKQLIDVFGHTDTHSTYTHVHVRVTQLQFPESAKGDPSKIHFNMVLEVIK